jgi:hypothetical protein
LQFLELCLAGYIFTSGKKANLNSQYFLPGAMDSPFRYDEGVTIYTNGGRIAPGL